MCFLLLNTVEASELKVDGAWVSKPLTAHTDNVAAFAIITNLTKEPVTIVGASSDYAKKLQLHQNLHEDGVVRMRSVTSITIPPGGKIHLNPDGLHLMLIGLINRPWKVTHINIQLHLETGAKVTQKFELRSLDHTTSEEHQHH